MSDNPSMTPANLVWLDEETPAILIAFQVYEGGGPSDAVVCKLGPMTTVPEASLLQIPPSFD
jgi:hypothetical protein